MQPYYKRNNLNESYYYQIFNEAAMSADTPLNDASPIQQQMIQDKIAEMPTSLADKAKAFLKNNWKVLTVGAALLALSAGAGYMYRDSIPASDPNNKKIKNTNAKATTDFHELEDQYGKQLRAASDQYAVNNVWSKVNSPSTIIEPSTSYVKSPYQTQSPIFPTYIPDIGGAK